MSFRRIAVAHMPIIVFGVCYSFLVVLGVIAFAVYGVGLIPNYPVSFFGFDDTFSAGFWALLLLPYLILPPAYVGFRRMFSRLVAKGVVHLPRLDYLGYALLLILLFALLTRELVISDAFHLSESATNDFSSVEARFQIQERLGFRGLLLLQSLLPFTTYIALVTAVRFGKPIWWALASIAVIGTTIGLIALNMKWPVVLFYAGIAITVFGFAPRWVYVSTAASIAVTFCVYFAIATFVFRAVPAVVQAPKAETAKQVPAAPTIAPSQMEKSVEAALKNYHAPAFITTAAIRAPLYLKQAMVRLAVVYPYYYHVFSNEGSVCGGLIEQAHMGPKCRPAKLIYSRMFPNDQFKGRGTANAPVHVSAFALGGWPLAILSLVAAAAVLAFFSCIPLEANPTAGALRVVGTLAAYHLSQIPGEGVFFYDHGLLWVFLLLAALMLAAKCAAQLRASSV